MRAMPCPEAGSSTLHTENVEIAEEDRQTHPDARPGAHVLLAVSDTGCGMSEEVKAHIFEPFFTTKAPEHGTGLGLSVAYGIVKAHDGRILCTSAPGQGATFTVLLAAARGAPPADRPAPRATLPPARRETILVVDDEPAILRALELLLSDHGYRTHTAANVAEALVVCREQGGNLDAVVMDLGLPGPGGETCLAQIRRTNPRAKVIISSGSTWTGWREAGAAAFLAKPYPLSELLATLQQALAGDDSDGLLELPQHEALEVVGLRHAQDDRVVAGLAALLDDRHRGPRVHGRGGEDLFEVVLVDVVRARARDQAAAGPQELRAPAG